ncbi:hypothetical protein CVT25_013461 [Psilocybe cyanescens]|uniref:Uncharacterized protein n=1 Tax=Psilocybe cyanescens TaxID=93625 RepID=A0A409WTR7_PSICY|nr:hypothetical protein CVT25_013461 [Psilocybe cyanescens]
MPHVMEAIRLYTLSCAADSIRAFNLTVTTRSLTTRLMLALTVLAHFLQSSSTLTERLITIVNRCPQPITLYINGQCQGSLAMGVATNRAGLIYADANGGSSTGGSTTRVGLYSPTNYYYIVKDPDPLNAGWTFVTVSAVHRHTTPSQQAFPAPTSSPPQSPIAQCSGNDVGYTITFCLEKMFPPTESIVNMHPGRSSSKRLNLRLQRDVCLAMDLGQERANTNLELAGTKFCLDAGQSA